MTELNKVFFWKHLFEQLNISNSYRDHDDLSVFIVKPLELICFLIGTNVIETFLSENVNSRRRNAGSSAFTKILPNRA